MHRARRRPVSHGYVNPMIYWMALQAILQFMQLRRKPPVTAALIIANVVVHLRPGSLDMILPDLHEVCLQPSVIVKAWAWKKLILSAFYHVDDMHLIYNMISLLWKGVKLEGRLGSKAFARMMAVLLLLSHGSVVVITRLLSDFAGIHGPYYIECSVGFSSVLFAMKTILNSNDPTYSEVGGALIPTKYAAWAELLLIQFLVPRASFVGHLCGILAGIVYLKGSSVLTTFWQSISGILRIPTISRRRIWGSGRPTGSSGGRGVGQESSEEALGRRGTWRCLACTYHNQFPLNVCEMCETPRGQWQSSDNIHGEGNSPRSHGRGDASNGSDNSDPQFRAEDAPSFSRLEADELRRRRMGFYSR